MRQKIRFGKVRQLFKLSCKNMAEPEINVISVIMPVYNCQDFIEECLQSIFTQKLPKELKVELSIYEDGSTDNTLQVLEQFCNNEINSSNYSVIISKNTSQSPKGVGHGRNKAIQQCSGEYLCFCDADDIMHPERILTQYLVASRNHNLLVGTSFTRLPANSTENFTNWANNLKDGQLTTQIFQTFGPTLIMPTWFCHKSVYQRIQEGFDERSRGIPEDLLFFYKHLDAGGELHKCPESLMIYRYHTNATTFSISDETIRKIRLDRLESKVLSNWDHFTIWNAGKCGRRFYRSLQDANRSKVSAFCDIDPRKLSQKFYNPHPLKVKVPIVTPQDAKPPFIICVKTELTLDVSGVFRGILDSLSLSEGTHFFYFN